MVTLSTDFAQQVRTSARQNHETRKHTPRSLHGVQLFEDILANKTTTALNVKAVVIGLDFETVGFSSAAAH